MVLSQESVLVILLYRVLCLLEVCHPAYSKCVWEIPCLPQKGVADYRQVIGIFLYTISWVCPIKTTRDHQLCPQGTGLADTIQEVCMGHSHPKTSSVAHVKLHLQPFSPHSTKSGSPNRETFPTLLLTTWHRGSCVAFRRDQGLLPWVPSLPIMPEGEVAFLGWSRYYNCIHFLSGNLSLHLILELHRNVLFKFYLDLGKNPWAGEITLVECADS